MPAGAGASVENYDEVAELVVAGVKKTAGKISAKRLLPAAHPALFGRVRMELGGRALSTGIVSHPSSTV